MGVTLCNERPKWVTHLQFDLPRSVALSIDWESTTTAWPAMVNLKTITIAYHVDDEAPLAPYMVIGPHLSPSVQLLLLRPYGEAGVSFLMLV